MEEIPTDDGLWYWKGDTSSDEAIAHYYSVSLFHDLAAKGPEKARAAEHLRRISIHIIDNGWVLRDMDGKPTRWGRWDPQTLRESPLDMRSHSYKNSHRADLAPRPGFVPHKSGRRGLSPREMAAQRCGRPADTYDRGTDGRAVVEPVCRLMDYCLSRYQK